MLNLPYSNSWCVLGLLTEPRGASESSPPKQPAVLEKAGLISCKSPVICRSTPPSHSHCPQTALALHTLLLTPAVPAPPPSLAWALRVSLPEGFHTPLHLPTPQVWKLKFSATPRTGSFFPAMQFTKISLYPPLFTSPIEKNGFIFPGHSYCFPRPKVFHTLLYPTWKQKPLGILADAKGNFRRMCCNSAKNWEVWNGSE